MGGAREDTLETPSKAAGRAGVVERGNKPQPDSDYQRLRFHESGGEVHFHDDDRGLKCAIPLGKWHNLFQQIEGGDAVRFVDRKNGTVLTAKPTDSGGVADVEISLSAHAAALQTGGALERLAKFTNG